MRASKFLFPDRTEQTTRSLSTTAFEIGSGNGPELPMQVVQPYPTVWKPSSSRYFVRPAWAWYSVTTFDPGAGLDFPHGFRRSPRSTAFFAIRPAPIITCGFDVFVHDVIAAITTDPWSSSNCSPSSSAVTGPGRSATATALTSI